MLRPPATSRANFAPTAVCLGTHLVVVAAPPAEHMAETVERLGENRDLPRLVGLTCFGEHVGPSVSPPTKEKERVEVFV